MTARVETVEPPPIDVVSAGSTRRWLNAIGVDRTCLWLGAIAFLVAVTGITWGVPQATNDVTVRGWDVDGVAGLNVLSELHNFLVEPKSDWYTAYPFFHYLVQAIFYAPYLLYLKLAGGLTSPSAEYPFGFADPVSALATLNLISRGIAVAMTSGIVMSAYLTGKLLWDRTTGVLAAIGVLICGPMLFYTRTSNLDVPVQFWTALGVCAAMRIVVLGMSGGRAIALGAMAALAVATKDQAYAVWVPGLLYITIMHLRGRLPTRGDAPWGAKRWLPLATMFGASAVVYAIANAIVFRPQRFVSHVRYLLDFEHTFANVRNPSYLTVIRDRSVLGAAQLAGDAVLAVAHAMGPVLLVAGVVGAVLAWRQRPQSRMLLWLIAGFFVLALLPIRHMQYRYAIFPSFVMAFFAARAVAIGLERSGTRLVVAVATLIAGFGWQSARAADLTYEMVFDARRKAAIWLAEHARDGDRMAFFGGTHQLPELPRGLSAVWTPSDSAVSVLRSGRMRFVIAAPDYFSDRARERSTFLPESVYRALGDGSLGYRRVARFSTAPLIGGVLTNLPYVNPQVQIFERISPAEPPQSDRPEQPE